MMVNDHQWWPIISFNHQWIIVRVSILMIVKKMVNSELIYIYIWWMILYGFLQLFCSEFSFMFQRLKLWLSLPWKHPSTRTPTLLTVSGVPGAKDQDALLPQDHLGKIFTAWWTLSPSALRLLRLDMLLDMFHAWWSRSSWFMAAWLIIWDHPMALNIEAQYQPQKAHQTSVISHLRLTPFRPVKSPVSWLNMLFLSISAAEILYFYVFHQCLTHHLPFLRVSHSQQQQGTWDAWPRLAPPDEVTTNNPLLVWSARYE